MKFTKKFYSKLENMLKNKIWLSIDEAMNAIGCFVANVIIGTLAIG